MTTNQTIDGVPRELLADLADYGESGKAPEPWMVEKLRALLDAPAKPVEDLEADNVKLAADRAALSTELEKLRKAYRGVLAQLDADRPQGEPVAWKTGSITWAYEPDARRHGEQHGVLVVPLYAEQPAPVAVVLPERRALSHSSREQAMCANTWNACLDEVTRLNTN